jgi:hypothetical protein
MGSFADPVCAHHRGNASGKQSIGALKPLLRNEWVK